MALRVAPVRWLANVSAPQVAQVCNRHLKGNRTAFVVLRSVDGHRPVDLNGQAATRNPKLDGDKQSGKRGDHVGDRSNDKQQAKSRHFCSPWLSPSHGAADGTLCSHEYCWNTATPAGRYTNPRDVWLSGISQSAAE